MDPCESAGTKEKDQVPTNLAHKLTTHTDHLIYNQDWIFITMFWWRGLHHIVSQVVTRRRSLYGNVMKINSLLQER